MMPPPWWWTVLVLVWLAISLSPSWASGAKDGLDEPPLVVSVDEAVALAQEWLSEDPDPNHQGPPSLRAR